MALVDNTSITGGYGQQISDWVSGDDRIFTGILDSVLPPSDPSFADGYFNLKIDPNLPDADSIISLHVTQSSSSSGQITPITGDFVQFLFHVFSGSYEGLVSVGTQYWWSFRMESTLGVTITVATGQVAFLQSVTQTNVAGTPAVLTNNGQPQFRGFISQRPDLVPANQTIYNHGDFYFNSNPINTNGAGWVCTIGGVAPVTTWLTLSTGVIAPTTDPHFKGYTDSIPIIGTYQVDDYFWLTPAVPGDFRGIVCTTAGTPGDWRGFAPIGL